ncbi:MAG: ATP synthase F1 subunit delta [Planctomycetes bacterium]|nr:ATP synthase F1 subunit delta [Planctomycetota bacterium]NOG55956.1 ATP synthase F1 subunit delta [Planctomycetota bacterium]
MAGTSNATRQSDEVDAVAEVYAQSLFELVGETGDEPAYQQVLDELESIVEMADEDPKFGEFLHSRIISIPDRQESLKTMFGSGRVTNLLLRFLLVLTAKNRLGHLRDITTGYRRRLLNFLGRIEVEAISAGPMDQELLERVRQEIATGLGADPIITNTVDETLIGGLKLRIGDRLIDASVSARLRQMRAALSEKGAESIRSRFSNMLSENE